LIECYDSFLPFIWVIAWLYQIIITELLHLSFQALHQWFEVVFTSFDIHCDSFLFNIRIWANYHDISWWSKLINEADKLLIAHNHGLELVVGLDAGEFELLDNVWNFLKPMIVLVIGRIKVRDHQESAFLKQDDFVGSDGRAESLQTQLQLIDVWKQDADNLRPSLIECLIPDRRPEALSFVLEVVWGGLHDAHHFFVEHLVAHVFSDQVHFVNENEDFGILRQVSQRTQTIDVVLQVDLELFGCHVENENEHAHILKDMVSLRLEVLLHEAVLSTTVPQTQH